MEEQIGQKQGLPPTRPKRVVGNSDLTAIAGAPGNIEPAVSGPEDVTPQQLCLFELSGTTDSVPQSERAEVAEGEASAPVPDVPPVTPVEGVASNADIEGAPAAAPQSAWNTCAEDLEPNREQPSSTDVSVATVTEETIAPVAVSAYEVMQEAPSPGEFEGSIETSPTTTKRKEQNPDELGLPEVAPSALPPQSIGNSPFSGDMPIDIADAPNPVPAFLNSAKLQVTKLTPRRTDFEIENAFVPLIHRNDSDVYKALVRLSEDGGVKINRDVQRIQVGYKVLVSESGCSERALERAFIRLAALNYVVIYPVAHRGKFAHTYWVRTPEAAMAMLRANGCTHIRVLRGKVVQLLDGTPFNAAEEKAGQ